MRRMCIFLKYLLLFLGIVLIKGEVSWQVYAQEEVPIKVGWFYQPNYQEKVSEKSVYGYNYEYLNYIAQYTGWEYEFVEVSSFTQTYEMLAKGEIDLMGYILYTEERAQNILYSSLSAGEVYTSIFVKGDSEIAPYDYAAFDGMRVGCMESLNPSYLEFYAEKHQFSIELVYYENISEVHEAVQSGEVDAGVLAGCEENKTTRILASFSPKPFYFATKKDGNMILEQLDEAMNLIRIENPFYERDLYSRYIEKTKNIIYLSENEKQYILDSAPITVSYQENWRPVEGKNEKTGEFQGITADVFKKIEDLTNLSFQYEVRSGAIDFEKNIDILASFHNNFSDANANGYQLTSSYLNIPAVVVQRKDGTEESVNKIAVMEHFYSTKSTAYAKDNLLVTYTSTEECLEAVQNGEVSSAVLNMYSVEPLITKPRYNSLKMLPLYNENYELCIAINKKQEPELYSVLNKALDAISSVEMNQIILDNMTQDQTITFQKILEKMPIEIASVAVVVLLLVIGLLVFIVQKKQKYVIRISELLYTDELTKGFSFKGFERQAKHILETMENKTFYIIDFDINHFEEYNTINGHEAGNELLKIVSQIRTQLCEPYEPCARIQADHFVILVEAKNVDEVIEGAKIALQRIRDKVGNVSLLISFGIYEVRDPKGDIAVMCDCALAAKRTIKGNYERFIAIYDENIHKKQLDNMDLLSRFERALENGEFVAYYQPKYDCQTETIVGAEALVRWLPPNEKPIMPIRFIELLELNGLVRKLDLFMFEQVCKRVALQREKYNYPIGISVNISRVHLYDAKFVNHLVDLTEKYKVPASAIEIEITETAFIDNLHELIKTINDLQEVGFLVAIDDFGSGFSSLNMLKDIDVNVIKLDRGFLSDTSRTEKGNSIIKSILSLAQKLKVITVAEGIETKEQFEFLKESGCDIIQGFYFAKPVDEETFDKML